MCPFFLKQRSSNIYHCLPDELHKTCRDGDGEGERKPKIIYYAGQFFEANCKIFRVKLSFIGQGKREKCFHFKYYEVCAQTAQGQRLKQLVKWPVLNILLLKTFQLLVFRSFY